MKTIDASELRKTILNKGAQKKSKSKYNAIKCTIDGITFDSKLEAKHYMTLRNLVRSGEISQLQTQVDYPLEVNGVHIANYKADFVYVNKDGDTLVEDTKGFLTKEYRLKKKLVKAIYGVDIIEVYSDGKRK